MYLVELFTNKTTNYATSNPDYYLEATSCILNIEGINEGWSIELEHPLDDNGIWKYIVEEAVIRVKTFHDDLQLFTIHEVVPSMDGIKATCLPIFIDAAQEVMVFPTTFTNSTPTEIANNVLSGSKYKFQSSITDRKNLTFGIQNGVNALCSGDEDSVIGVFGGELYYDNHTLSLDKRIGVDSLVECSFGYNQTGITVTKNTDNMATYLVPVAYNDILLPEKFIKSPLADTYKKKYYKIVSLTDYKLQSDCYGDEVGYADLNALYAAMRTECNRMFSEDKVDIPFVNYDIDFLDLTILDEYQDVKQLLYVGLGDTIKCINEELGIETENRVISMDYDCLFGEIKKLELGDYRGDIVDNIFSDNITTDKVNSIITPAGTIMGSQISGIINAAQASLRGQQTVAQKSDYIAVLFENLDPSSATFGALAIGTQGIQISKTRSGDNRSWIWGTAIDYRSVYAQHIIAGILSDIKGQSYWNLDTGEMVLKSIEADDILVDGMVAFNADVEGTITSKSGIIGNWTLSKQGLTSSAIIQQPNYTLADATKIMQFILGEITLTDSEKEYLDPFKRGYPDSRSYLMVQQIANGEVGKQWTYTYRIDGSDPSNFIRYSISATGYSSSDSSALAGISKDQLGWLQSKIDDLERRI